MNAEQAVNIFIHELALMPVPEDVYNQYSYDSEANEIRRANLSLYFQQMQQRKPRLLLVGEAAGHRGCRLTGVPFSSESILLKGFSVHGLLGKEHGFCKTGEKSRVVKEQSATIVWNVIRKQPEVPLLWNILPFHPHRKGQRWSNRTPRARELVLGKRFLTLIIEIFAVERIVAVGNKAADGMTRWGIVHHKIRHPSHGGKKAFSKGLRALLH